VRAPLNPRFFEQLRIYDLRFTCPDCVHFTGQVCAHEWPTADHLAPPAPDATEIATCKEFELA
jgi:hypothetical protein